jgi:Ca-activated chloride channel homolog
VQRSLIAAAGTPKGDMAFAVAVAAYGQKLRGDPMLAGYDWTRVAALAGEQGDYSRSEFVKLVSLAGSLARP